MNLVIDDRSSFSKRLDNLSRDVKYEVNKALDKIQKVSKKVQKVSSEIFNYFETVLWKYIKGTRDITKNSLKVLTLACTGLKGKLNPIIAQLGMFSLISCLLSLKAIPSHIESLIEHVKLRDGEGVALSLLSLITAPLITLESIISTIGSLVALEIIPTIAVFSLIGLPIAITLVGYSALRGLYNVIRCGINFHKLPKSLQEGNIEDFKAYIEKKIDVTVEENQKLEMKYGAKKAELGEEEVEKCIQREVKIIKDRKRNILTRHTDKKIYNIMRNLQTHLDEHPEDLDTANKALRDMKKLMVRKITLGSIGVASDVALLVTLACSAAFPISAFAAPVVGGVRAGVSLGRHFYQQNCFDKGLELREFTKIS